MIHSLWSDFLNSQWHDWRGSGRSEDRLLLPTWQTRYLDTYGLSAPVPAHEEDILMLQHFRTQLHHIALRLSQGGSLTEENLDLLNKVLAQGDNTRRLLRDADGLRLASLPNRSDWQQVMAEIATDFARNIIEGASDRIRICDNPDCLWVFYDDTRNRTKRYCDDKMCGNLMKVRRFRAKKKVEQARD
ncbi:CGNR zinc finger domain-containing protein [Paenibacillus terrigena]|uniref:CGNR zinc finger domain-containing protein n=1 Tax=Paenibacillus terrigena TaxID=369333 RepID=UPI0028D70CB2|nr:CGNR zinc finger domain-containing protein [Paenibacillus terrigena]